MSLQVEPPAYKYTGSSKMLLFTDLIVVYVDERDEHFATFHHSSIWITTGILPYSEELPLTISSTAAVLNYTTTEQNCQMSPCRPIRSKQTKGGARARGGEHHIEQPVTSHLNSRGRLIALKAAPQSRSLSDCAVEC